MKATLIFVNLTRVFIISNTILPSHFSDFLSYSLVFKTNVPLIIGQAPSHLCPSCALRLECSLLRYPHVFAASFPSCLNSYVIFSVRLSSTNWKCPCPSLSVLYFSLDDHNFLACISLRIYFVYCLHFCLEPMLHKDVHFPFCFSASPLPRT